MTDDELEDELLELLELDDELPDELVELLGRLISDDINDLMDDFNDCDE